jgi:hypothetical protein
MWSGLPHRDQPFASANVYLVARMPHANDPRKLLARKRDLQIDRNAQRNSIRGMWRTIARPVTFFDVCSPINFFDVRLLLDVLRHVSRPILMTESH